MKENLLNILKSVFSIFILLSIFGGGFIFFIFLIGLIIGGDTGESLAVLASKTIMPYFIKMAAIGILSGLLSIYISREHHLSLK